MGISLTDCNVVSAMRPSKVGYRPYPTFSGIVPRSVPQFFRGCRRTSSDGFAPKFPVND